ncbi:hypothetical protein GBF38_000056 [Nibea albiflora]|nr:hypothetical protein GBF38_000056 [Nibea albiflora]
MNLLQGQASHITGRSVHNQRIDVFQQVVHYFDQLFYSFEDEQILNPEDNTHKMALQVEIQRRLNLFTSAWNNHRIRSANNHTPTQMRMEGMLSNSEQESAALNNVFGDDPYSEESLEAALARHGIQLTQLEANNEDLDPRASVSQPPNNLTSEQQRMLQNAMDGAADLKERYTVCTRELQNSVLTTEYNHSNLQTMDAARAAINEQRQSVSSFVPSLSMIVAFLMLRTKPFQIPMSLLWPGKASRAVCPPL